MFLLGILMEAASALSPFLPFYGHLPCGKLPDMEPRQPHSLLAARQSPEVTAAIDREWDATIKYYFKGERCFHANIRTLIDDFSRRLRVSPSPRFYVTKAVEPVLGGTSPNMFATALPVAKHYGQVIVSTQRMLDLFHYTPHGPVAPPLQAAIAHEMAHMRHGPQLRAWQGMGHGHLGIGAATTIGALALLDYFTRHDKKGAEGLHESAQEIHAQLQRERGEMPEEAHALAEPLKQHESLLLRGAELIAAAALGVGAMKMSMKHITPKVMRALEFDADKVAAELLGDHQPVKELLIKIEEDWKLVRKNQPEQFRNITRKQWEYVETNLAHPTLVERLLALDEVGKTLSARSRTVVR